MQFDNIKNWAGLDRALTEAGTREPADSSRYMREREPERIDQQFTTAWHRANPTTFYSAERFDRQTQPEVREAVRRVLAGEMMGPKTARPKP